MFIENKFQLTNNFTTELNFVELEKN